MESPNKSHNDSDLTKEGRLYSWGIGTYFRLGLGDNEGNLLVPTLVKGVVIKKDAGAVSNTTTFVAVLAGGFHSLGLSEEGRIFSWGLGADGQLGHNETQSKRYPELIESISDKKFVCISAGMDFSAAVSEDGRIYTWGKGSGNQLGHGTQDNVAIPKMIVYSHVKPVKFVQVSTGCSFAVALTDQGTLWSWGNGESGRLGHGNEEGLLYPKLIENKDIQNVKFKRIYTGGFSCLALTDSAEIYSWGWGRSGRLGHGHENNILAPEKINSPIKFSDIATSTHSMALSEEGHIYTWGPAAYGVLGHGKWTLELAPKRIESVKHLKFVAIAAGDNHSLGLTKEGCVYSWGRQGRLGFASKENMDDKNIPTLIEHFEPNVFITYIAAGREHSIAIGKLLSDKDSNQRSSRIKSLAEEEKRRQNVEDGQILLEKNVEEQETGDLIPKEDKKKEGSFVRRNFCIRQGFCLRRCSLD